MHTMQKASLRLSSECASCVVGELTLWRRVATPVRWHVSELTMKLQNKGHFLKLLCGMLLF